MSDVRKPKPTKFEPTVWTADQLHQFLKAAKDSPYFALFLLAADSGMRLGDILGARWCDLDFAGSVLNVTHSLCKVDGVFTLKAPKTAAGRRKVSLGRTVIAALHEHRKSALANRHYGSDRPIFAFAWTGDFIDGTTLYNHVFLPLVKAARVPTARFHDLRHGCATLLLSAGVDLATVSARLGHGSKVTTLGIYSQAIEGGQDQATSVMERVISGKVF